jgi:hypothetical protein
MQNNNKKVTYGSLVLANIVPLFGVIFFSWDITTIIYLYWFENIVIGVFNVLKMIRAKGKDGNSKKSSKLFLVPFFMFHFGFFTLIHGVFVTFMFGSPSIFPIFAILVLIFSHGISYIKNYLGAKEYTRLNADTLFWQPYKRIFVIHFVIVFGGVLSLDHGSPFGALMTLITLKTILDLTAHTIEHKKIGTYVSKTKTQTQTNPKISN